MYRCPCASRVPIHRSMCIDAHTCIRIRKRACVYVHVHVHQCMCACIPMCLRGCLRARVCGVCIYGCTFVHIYTHRHTRTYPGGNTHPCVCVCVCVSVCLSVCLWGESTSILQKGLFCPTPIKASDTSTSKRETTPDERSGQEARTDPFLPKKGGTGRHPEAQGRTHIHGRAGLGWAGLSWGSWGWGRAHGSTPPRGVSLDNDPSHSEGKGPGAGNRNHDSKFEPSEDSGS